MDIWKRVYKEWLNNKYSTIKEQDMEKEQVEITEEATPLPLELNKAPAPLQEEENKAKTDTFNFTEAVLLAMKNKGECAMSKEQEEMQQATEEHIEQPLPDEPKEEQSEPMGILTSRAHEDMTLAILQVQAAYGLPAYLTDLIVTAVLADIRGCANKDLLNALSRKE